MFHISNQRLAPVFALTASALLLGGCGSAESDSGADIRKFDAAKASTTTVEKASISGVIKLEGSIATYPAKEVLAPATGDFTPKYGSVTNVSKGQIVGTVKICTSGKCVDWNVRSPSDGKLAIMPPQSASKGDPLGEVKKSGFQAIFPLGDDGVMYQFANPPLSIEGQITNGPAGFPLKFEQLSEPGEAGGINIETALPSDIKVFPGLKIHGSFTMNEKSDVLALPRSAVRGGNGEGQVVAIKDGQRQIVPVGLGVSDSTMIEVRGILEGTTVLTYPLAIDFENI